MDNKKDNEALLYHSQGKPGKVSVVPSKPSNTEHYLSLAYSPGVAAPCKEIARDPDLAYKYTTKGNLVAVITNGTAVLGLGNIGPLAGKPVMEGKGVLFKEFANIDVFDLEIQTETTEEFIQAVKALEPTFGGINLEDIKAPECFIIEERLKKEMNIPVFHDDQHGTAIISGAALLNACEITKRKLKNIKVVFNGAGAAAIACANLFFKLGVLPKNLLMCDSSGVIYKGRQNGMNEWKEPFAQVTSARTLADALKDADVFCGLSVAGVFTGEMLKSMAKNPIVFAMANPDPEILPEDALKVRKDVIIATGRSDYPNQVNNVLGFPSIFRGALDVHATQINEEMKLAAVHALADLAKQDVPDPVLQAYNNKKFSFGTEYIIPKPFDPRVLMNVAPAVAKAAMDTGVARKPIKNFKEYRESLEALESVTRGFMRTVMNKIKYNAKQNHDDVPSIIFPEGRSEKVLRALNTLIVEKICKPILIGYEDEIRAKIESLDLENLKDIPIYRPSKHPKYPEYCAEFYKMRQRKGIMEAEAERLMTDPYYFAAMAVHMKDVDGTVSGSVQNYADCVKPILQIVGVTPGNIASGLNIVLFKDKMYFFSDTTININPTAEEIAKIAVNAADAANYFKQKPKIAMLSFSNFTGRTESALKMQKAAELVKELRPEFIVDGEMQADTAVNGKIIERIFPFSEIKNGANVLVFPNLDAGNIAYKLIQQLSEGEVLGPFLMGVNRAANVMQRTGTVTDCINTVILTALEAQAYKELRDNV